MNKPKIFIDADDTLWENESYFRAAEAEFAAAVAPDDDPAAVQQILWQKQEENIPIFGYGSKTYLIGMMDAALEYMGGTLPRGKYDAIKDIIVRLVLHNPILFPNVESTLEKLSRDFDLVMVTKGDAVEQMKKVDESGLAKYFLAVEVVRFKNEEEYKLVARKYNVDPKDIIMVGDSIKSDICPVVNLGGKAIHIPHKIVWVHELAEMPRTDRVIEAGTFADLTKILPELCQK